MESATPDIQPTPTIEQAITQICLRLRGAPAAATVVENHHIAMHIQGAGYRTITVTHYGHPVDKDIIHRIAQALLLPTGSRWAHTQRTDHQGEHVHSAIFVTRSYIEYAANEHGPNADPAHLVHLVDPEYQPGPNDTQELDAVRV